MTASRGRALIINIRDEQSTDSSERREGSEHDYYNLTKMFEKFGFIISELSGDKNWEAKVFHAYNHQPIFGCRHPFSHNELISAGHFWAKKTCHCFNISLVIANGSVWDE